jgi:integrase
MEVSMIIPKFLQGIFFFRIESEDRKEPTLLSKFMDQLLEYSKSNYRPGTVGIYERAEELFIEIIGDIMLEQVTPFHWDKYQSVRLQKVSPVTVNIELRTLCSVLNKAFRWKVIDHNPFALLHLCLVPEKYPDYFSREEFQIFCNAMKNDWYKDIVQFAVLTGMRRGEITNLRWENIDLEKKLIHVVSSPTFRTKAGKKRIVPIHKKLVPILKSRLNHDPEEFVFTHRKRKVKESYVTHRFSDYKTISGIQKKGLHFHSLRHTFASWLVQEGVSLYEVQRLLGHSNIAVTEIYSHLQPCQLHNAVNKLQILETRNQLTKN